MQEICNLNPPVITRICDPNKSRSQHHRSLKLGLKLKYLNKKISLIKNEKLIPNLGEKKKIQTPLSQLKTLTLGLQLKKFIQYKNSNKNYFENYILDILQSCEENQKKKLAKSKPHNAKLRKNGIFGNLIENPINKVHLKNVTTRKQYLKRENF